MRNLLAIVWLSIVLLACSSVETVEQHQPENKSAASPVRQSDLVIDALPQHFHEYQYAGSHHYDKDLGYTVRYAKTSEYNHYADFFIWPTPEQINHYPHDYLVQTMGKSSLGDIYLAQDQGAYEKVMVLDSETFSMDGKTLVMYKLSLIRENLQVLSYLVVTEHKGSLLKARISLPDNESNRAREDVEGFAVLAFKEIMSAMAVAEGKLSTALVENRLGYD